MRRLVPIVFVIIAACSGEAGAGATMPSNTTVVPEQAPTTVTTTPATSTTETSGTTVPEATRALVTPTGVVVSVLNESVNGFRVTTPCGNETVVREGTPVGRRSVVIDPGHGGEVDTGAVGANGLMEKHLNLEVAQALEANLIVRGIDVLLTRTADYATRLGVRAALGDQVDADLIISVHHNAPTPGPSTRPGTEIFIQSASEDSRRLGGLVWRHVVDALSEFEVDWSAAPDAGVLSVLSTTGNDAYGMIRTPSTVSVLAELGYISNRPEAELFATNEYVEAASEALADAVDAYLGTDARGAGFVAEPRVFNPQPGIGGSLCVDPVLE